jgi:hypothetical protein
VRYTLAFAAFAAILIYPLVVLIGILSLPCTIGAVIVGNALDTGEHWDDLNREDPHAPFVPKVGPVVEPNPADRLAWYRSR